MSRFVKLFSSNVHYQTVRASELKFWEKVPLPPPVKYQVSHVMCHMTHVTCHLSPVTCHMSHVFFSFIFFGKSSEASQGRVCYQRGLPRLVSTNSALCLYTWQTFYLVFPQYHCILSVTLCVTWYKSLYFISDAWF